MLDKLKQIFWILGIIGANGIIILTIFFYIPEFYTLLTLLISIILIYISIGVEWYQAYVEGIWHV
jgi:hypothetical protein